MEFLTMAEVAAELGIDIKTVRRHMADGNLHYINFGRGTARPRIKISRQQVSDFIERQTRRGEQSDYRTALELLGARTARTAPKRKTKPQR
jgi:excisionase family DNA binding protein